ncbi:MAG: hypothetical protein IRY83_15520 [Chloroflexi bacterium]|nr:hypothetical protein [Chloroflexota bacterium]
MARSRALRFIITVVAVVLLLGGCAGDSGPGFVIPDPTALMPVITPTVPPGVQHDFVFESGPAGAHSSPDWDIPGGHFFTQTGGGTGLGYAVVDDDAAKFWTAFTRFGGVPAVGYPASQRFQWDGFTVQVFQRVIFQWHPETQSVAFVNTFDRLSELGRDDWLLATHQIPPPLRRDERGKSWDQIVRERLALLDASPAIRAKYYAVVGDPIQANGLPTSAVTDMGNHLALRAQRVEFQLWKEDVPWAKAGTVTVALGGDIAKEAGILPDQSALRPIAPPGGGQPAGPVRYDLHRDDEKIFKFPWGWQPQTVMRYDVAHNYYISPSGSAAIYYLAKYGMGLNFKLQDFVINFVKAMAGRGNFFPDRQEQTTIDGRPAMLQWYTVTGDRPVKGVAMVLQDGSYIHFMSAFAATNLWSAYEPYLLTCIRSYRIPTRS